MKSVFKAVSPYEEDEMNLPVENVDESVPFYETVMGFQVALTQRLSTQKRNPRKR